MFLNFGKLTLCCLLVAIIQGLARARLAESSQSYSANSIGAHQSYLEHSRTKYGIDSQFGQPNSIEFHRYVVAPIAPMIRRQQQLNDLIVVENNRAILGDTNKIGGFGKFRQQYHKPAAATARSLISRARTVESPAHSVDSGGRASNSLTGELAKFLNLKQGFYSDIYDKLDAPPGALDKPAGTTKAPADAIEDSARASIIEILSQEDRPRRRI